MIHSGRRLFTAIGFAVTLAVSSAAALAPVGQAHAQGLFSHRKYAAIVVDANTGEVLYTKRADEQRYPASITKIMTLYLTFEALATGRLTPNERIVVSQHAYNQAPSKLGLKPGETISVDDAIRAAAVKSANDIAVALAEKIGGTEEHFAQLMTTRAHELGMTHTRFYNANGLPNKGRDENVTTARDIAILSRAVMRDYPQYYSYFSVRSFDWNGHVTVNHNHLLAKMPGVDGLKTGYTNAAGFNLAASAVRDGRRLITVVLGGTSTAARDENVETLLTAGFDVLHRRQLGQNITVAQLADPEELNGPIQRAPIEMGDADQESLKVETAQNMAPFQPAPVAAPVIPNRVSAKAMKKVAVAAADDDAPSCAPVHKSRHHGRKHHAAKCETAVAKNGHKGKHGSDEDTAVANCDSGKHHKRHHHAKACEAETQVAERKHGKHKGADEDSSGGYVIQVGAYKSRAQAKEHLAKVNGLFDSGAARVEKAGHTYRARFGGMTQKEAKAACHKLAAKGHPCSVMADS